MSNHDMKCGHCGRTWNDKETPTPAARCPYEYDHEKEKEMRNPQLPDWYGVVKGVKFKSNGPMSDPGLVYKGKEFNYWDMQDALVDMFEDDMREEYPDDEYLESINWELGADDEFSEWLENNQERVRDYFDEVILGGYF